MSETDQIISQAEQRWWQGHPDEALALLLPASSQPGYFPRGTLVQAFILRALGNRAEAEALARAVADRVPSSVEAWEILAFAAIDRADYYTPAQAEFAALCPGLLQALRQAGAMQRKGLRRVLIYALIHLHPDDAPDLLAKAQEGGVVSPAEVEMTRRCLAFLAALKAALAGRAAPPASWSLAVLGGGSIWREAAGGHLQLDLSFFRGARMEEAWHEGVAWALAAALLRLLPAAAFRDIEAGATSSASLDEADLPGALLTTILLSRVLEAAELDQDVRPAGRAMRLSPGSLVLRAGRVELWALTAWLKDRAATLAASAEVAERAATAEAEGNVFADNGPDWPRLAPAPNITLLWTNAGWYPASPATAPACLDDWACRYRDALLAGELLVECAEDFQRLATLLPDLRARPLHDWDQGAFLRALHGNRLVLATPFWREIQAQWDSGALRALWREAGLMLYIAALRTVEAPMSVWPHRPDADWSASFARLERDCHAALKAIGGTVFIASCGSYGLPITHAMHRAAPGLTALYNGHLVHGWFGMLTNDVLGSGLHALAPSSPHWCRADLAARFPGVERIDDGRYVLDAGD